MKLELQPISSIEDTAIWHEIVELMSLFNGSCSIDDFEWDDDQLLQSLLENLDDESLREDYRAEPQAGIQAAKDGFITSLRELIAERQTPLGINSPFSIPVSDHLLLERRSFSQITLAGLSYAWLTLFWVISASSEYVIIAKADRDEFIRVFAALFEYICCLVMFVKTDGRVFYFGDSRDVREFLARLSQVVNVAGSGAAKAFADLEGNQTGANDAGIDVMAITTRGGLVRLDSTAYLLGATIQKSDRRNKIIGIDQIRRFTAYFSRGPILAYMGVLAIPFPASPAEALTCRDRNCSYLTKDEIIENLAKFPSQQGISADIQRPRRKMLRKSKEWRTKLTLASKAGEHRITWA